MPARKRVPGHPLMEGREKGVWHPDLAGRVPGYPKSEEAYQARRAAGKAHMERCNALGIATRRGVPDGWAGRKQEAIQTRAEAKAKAVKVVQIMKERDLIVPIPAGDEARAEIALTFAAETVLDETVERAHRIAAAKLLAEFTRAKPSQKQEVTVRKAEDYLNDILGE